MKIIGVDNYARDHIADYLVCEKVYSKELGVTMVNALNRKASEYYYMLVADDYRLSRGMEDLV